ncbi:MAG: hypothetical protein HQ488_04055 [Parcubacteria group bacterium]|nr:hypothetical protein [Parcubacteria group bacterium]
MQTERTDLINGPVMGIIMREACRRAMYHARTRCFDAKAKVKGRKADGREDWITEADPECQKIVVDLLRECFPDLGIIAEEEGLNVPCAIVGEDIYFTVDPIDGTSAYKRHQSQGWGFMLALVRNGVVIAVCIGDANSGDQYYYRPYSENNHRLFRQGEFVEDVPLEIDKANPLGQQAVQLRDLPDRHNQLVQELVAGNLFLQEPKGTKVKIAEGSIGLSMAQLWKGEVGACILRPGNATPWDDTPVIGMSLRLGFVFLRLIPGEGENEKHKLVMFTPTPPKAETPQPHQILVIHNSRMDELCRWCSSHNLDVVVFAER